MSKRFSASSYGIGDGFQFGAAGPAFRKHWERVKELLKENGRSADDFGAEVLDLFGAGVITIEEAIALFNGANNLTQKLGTIDPPVDM